MKSLPKLLQDLTYWWFIKQPNHIFTVGRRILILIDSTLAFSINFRLMFTPLFGDYTLVGRCVGFITRLIEIIVGFCFVVLFGILVFVSPILWLTGPILLAWYSFELTLIYILIMSLLWYKFCSSIPNKKVTNVSKDSIFESFRPEALKAVRLIDHSWRSGLVELLSSKKIVNLCKRAELNPSDLGSKLVETSKPQVSKISTDAFNIAFESKSRFVELEHVFLAIIQNTQTIETLLASLGTNLQMLVGTAKWIVSLRESSEKMFLWQDDYQMLFTGGIGRGMTGRVTPYLDSMSQDFTKMVQHGRIKKIIGRENEIKKVAELLTGSKDNILIIGEPGSGKTSIVKGIAYKIIEGTEYKSLKNKRIVNLELSGLIAGTKSAGEISEKINRVMNEVEGSADIIIFIDEIHELVAGVGNEKAETSSIFSALEPKLSSDKLQFIGATSISNYRKFIEPNGAVSRQFQIVEIPESSTEDTLEILEALAPELEARHKAVITYPALVKAINLAKKLIRERVFPDKAIDVVSRATASSAEHSSYITAELISQEISEMTNIPVESVTADEAKQLLSIEEEMQKMVVGQDHAIKQISSALKRARAGMRDESRPIASFLFVGTTGVGKTQTAKALAKSYFKDSKALIRLDMSEYQQLDSIDRLIGTPDGSQRGILTESVRTRPFALVLLDELEKAQSNILHTFLQVLDDGRLTDTLGTVVDFTNTIIIATSNVGTRSIQQVFESGGSFDQMKESAMKEVREKFSPEFLNRFTGIIVFNPLSYDNVRSIADILLTSVKKLATEKGVALTFKPELIDEVIKRGYSPQWGARPLARVIEDTIESYMAEKFLAGVYKTGDKVELGLEALG